MRRRAAVSLAVLAIAGDAVSGICVPAHGAEPVEAALSMSPDAPARLVLPHWPLAGWLVRQSGRLAEVTMPGARLEIVTEGVALPAWDGALVALASEITGEGAVLRIGFGCDCTLAIHGDGERLRIDIVGAGRVAGPLYRDPGPAPRLARVPPPRAGAATALVGQVAPEVEETRSRLLEQLRRAAEAGLVALRPEGGGLLAAQDDDPRAEGGPIASDPGVGDRGVGDPGGDGFRGNDAGRAAFGPALPAETGEAEIGASVTRAALPAAPVQADHGAPRRLAAPPPSPVMPSGAVASARASSLEEVRERLIAHAAAPECLASEDFRLPDPLPPRAFLEEVSRLRRAMIGEFDRPDPSTALTLARLYLGHGLGAEALQLLSEFAPAEPETPLLAAIARLAEERPLPPANLLAVPGCKDQHALWQAFDAALAGRPADAMRLLDHAAGALEQVTHGLRGRLAVHLGLAAAEHGDWITAHRLETMARRSLAAKDRGGQELRTLLAALTLRERGDLAEASRLLASLGGARSHAGAEALIILAELASEGADQAVALGEAPALDRLRLDLGALVTAHRGTRLGDRAFRAEVMTTGRLLGRAAAFDLLAQGRSAGLIDEAAHENLLAEAGRTLPDDAGDTPLAILYENDPARFFGVERDRDFRVALARSYLSLGAPALAERALFPGDLADAKLREALSAAYLEIGDPRASPHLASLAHGGPSGGLTAGGRLDPAVRRGLAAPAGGKGAARREGAGEPDGSAMPPDGAEALSGPELPRMLPARDGGAAPAERRPSANAPERALRLALAASRAGLSTPPAEAVKLLASDPGLEAGLRAIFAARAGGAEAASDGAISRLLDSVSDETRLYREVLRDG